MKNAFLFLGLLALLLFPAVSAEAEKLDDRWVFFGETWERDDVVYYVEESGDKFKMLLYVDDTPYIINDGDCKDDIVRKQRYCIQEAAYDDENKWENYIKYESGEELFAFHLYTYTLEPELKVTRTLKPTTPELFDQTMVTVTLENEGEEDVTYVKYTEKIPDDLKVQPVEGKIVDGNYTYEVRLITPGNKHVFQYRVYPQDYETITLDPFVSYVYDFQRKEADVDKLSLKIAEPFTVTRTLSDKNFGINEKGTYTLRITNKEEQSVSFKVAIDIPEGMTVSEIRSLKQEGNRLVHEDKISADAYSQMSFAFRTPKTGDYTFDVNVTGIIEGQSVERIYEEKFTTKTLKLEPRIVFSQTENKITEGNTATLSLYLINNEPESSYIKIKGKVTSDFVTEEITSDLVAPEEEQLVGEFTVVAPIVEKRENKEIVFSGTYQSYEGETFNFEKKLTVAVEPTDDLFAITHEPNITTAYPGQVVKFTVDVKNLAGRYVFASTQDVLPIGVTIVSGNNFADISFEEDQKRQVYIYEFKIPDNFEGSFLPVTTKIREEQSALVQEHTTNITLTAPPDVIDEQEEEDEIVDVPAQPEVEQKKEGFLTRLWNVIKGWLS